MKQTFATGLAAAIIVAMTAAACGGGSSSSTPTTPDAHRRPRRHTDAPRAP